MLETALETALVLRGMPSQSCYHCEWEAVTASVLRRFIDASGSDSLIHGNMFTADCTGLRGKVDAVVAGLPCPAFSCAGKQKGNGDSRAWGEDFDPADESTWGPQPHYLRLAEQILPGIVIIENVPQYLTGGHYAPVGEILYPMGYEYQDAILGTASSVGGSHKRERCFIMAVHREYDIWARLREIGVEELADSLRNGAGKGSGNGKKSAGPISEGTRGWQGIKSCNRDETVADIGGAGCEGDERGSTHGEPGTSPSGSASERRKELGDCDCETRRDGPCSGKDSTGRRRCGLTETGVCLPIHAPGIEAYMAWSAVARVDPTRMPSIERGVSVVASEPSVSNVDLLRIGGNCVDALEATACIGCLLDRWLEGC